MNQAQIEQFANEMIEKHVGKPWHFKWITRGKAYGTCDERDWSIALSSVLFDAMLNKDDAKEVIMHEIAHAQVGCVHGHNEEWKRAARRLGIVNPKSTADYAMDDSKRGFKYHLIDIVNGCVTKHGGYLRKPRKSLVDCWMPKRKAVTTNRLYYVTVADLAAHTRGNITTAQLQVKGWK
jgi:predicted SprT family Zn-dependent metalloprotease